MPVIRLDHITKEFRLGQIQSVFDTLKRPFSRMRGEAPTKRPTFRALGEIDLQVGQGEVVGIIGTNGAGKSTLLKIICRVTVPTSGNITVKGSIAPLIEVGAGLHPELTGRENIFLNGSILGIPRQAIKRLIPEIIEFAELEEFIDTPIKRYSSGMKVRLGFAIATSIEADILIVDEVLAVGDLAFQRKCFDRMEQLIKHSEKTVLMVSHNIRQVQRMCSRVVLLDRGRILDDGQPQRVCGLFYERSNAKILHQVNEGARVSRQIRTSGEIELREVRIVGSDGNFTDSVATGDDFQLQIDLQFNAKIEQPEVVIGVHTTDFVYLTANTTAPFGNRPTFEPGHHTIHYILPRHPLAPGSYAIRVAVFDRYRRALLSGENLRIFSVRGTEQEVREAPLRLVNTPCTWVLQGQRFEQDLVQPQALSSSSTSPSLRSMTTPGR